MRTARALFWIVVAAGAGVGVAAGWASAAPDAGAVRDGLVRRGSTPDGGTPVDLALVGPPSPLIFPAQSIPLRFDHARHLKLGVRCESCHVAAATSTSVGDNLIPAEAACRACHAIDRAQPAKVVPAGAGAARCDACHVAENGQGWMPRGATFSEPPRVRLSRPNLKFNHKLHVGRGVGCEACHTKVAMEGLATREDLPRMALCLGCHDGKQTTNRCGACHLTEPDGRLRTNLASAATAALGAAGKLMPSGVLRGFDRHDPTFARDHVAAGRMAEGDGYCLTCHKRSECIDCHGGTVRPFDIHPSDYVSLHGIDARRNTPDCSSCHRTQTFCVGCHQRLGVAPDPEGGQRGQQPHNPFGTGTQLKSFHPPGWVLGIGGGASSGHANQARRNIRSCVSCHREQSCLDCHSTDPTRGAGVSPHGPAFGATSRCRALAARNQRACLKCHALGSPELDCEMR